MAEHGNSSTIAHICTLDPDLIYKSVNESSDYCMVASPTSIMIIGLQKIKKGAGILARAAAKEALKNEGSFSFLNIGQIVQHQNVQLLEDKQCGKGDL